MSYQVVGKAAAADNSDDDIHVRRPASAEPVRHSWTTLLVGLNITLTVGALLYASSHGGQSSSSNQDQLDEMKASLLAELARSRPASAAAAAPMPEDGRVADLQTQVQQMKERLQDTEAELNKARSAPAAPSKDAAEDDDRLEVMEQRLQRTQSKLQDTEAQLAQALAAPPAEAGGAAASAHPDFTNILVYKGIADLGQRGELHSQFAQDWVISSILGCKKGGFFIDLAANDYKELSNTLMLERDFGWQGICLDANSQYIYGLAKRKCRTAIGAIGSPKNEKVQFVLRGALGGIFGHADNKKHIKGTVIELNLASFVDTLEALGAPTTIDYMSLDVEGAEEIVMATFPWDKYTILTMTVERPSSVLEKQLESHGYKMLRPNKNGDEFWVHKSLPGLERVESTWGDLSKLPESTCMDELKYPRPADSMIMIGPNKPKDD